MDGALVPKDVDVVVRMVMLTSDAEAAMLQRLAPGHAGTPPRRQCLLIL